VLRITLKLDGVEGDTVLKVFDVPSADSVMSVSTADGSSEIIFSVSLKKSFWEKLSDWEEG
jgi:hypothetical protein